MDKNWYLTSKYAIYVTWAFEGENTLHGCGCYPDGSLPKTLDELAEAFDVEAFADDCVEIGVQYVNFTAYHANMYVLYPSKIVAQYLPGHATTTRDVVRELADVLHKRGIRLQLYIHATIGDTMTEEDRKHTHWHDATNGYLGWNNFINAFLAELAVRYKGIIDSYYFDMIFDKPFLTMIDKDRLYRTLRERDPDVLITGNGEANDAVDYGSREDGMQRVNHVEDRVAYPTQTVICLCDWWWAIKPDTAEHVPYYTSEHLFQFLVLTAGANTCGGGLAIGTSPYVTKGFEPGVKETLAGIGKLIAPVAASIKNTVAGISYITPAGATIGTLPNGIVATSAPDGRYEYIHVLVPPKTNELVLPKPLDGAQFTDAVLLKSGTPLLLRTDADTVRITLDGAWDAVDTVIRLSAVRKPPKDICYRALDASSMVATCANAMPQHPASAVLDGDEATFWCTSGSTLSTIDIDIGEIKCIGRVRVLPRTDACSCEELITHICTYSIYVSVEGTHYIPVTTGEWKRSANEKEATFTPIAARFVRLCSGPEWLPEFYWKQKASASAAGICIDAVE